MTRDVPGGRGPAIPVVISAAILLLLVMAAILPCSSPPVRIAIVQLSQLPENSTADHAAIEEAVRIAASRHADWVVMPELAESGYEFAAYRDPDQLPLFPPAWFPDLETLAHKGRMTLFVGFPENDNGTLHNSVAVIGRNGRILGIERKTAVIPGRYEGWAQPGEEHSLIVDGHRVGYFICADAGNATLVRNYQSERAEILLSSAAWYPDPEMGPDDIWQNVSRTFSGPLIIANTVGMSGPVDFSRAESRIYRQGGIFYSIPVRSPAVAFADWDPATGAIRVAGDPVLLGGIGRVPRMPGVPDRNILRFLPGPGVSGGNAPGVLPS